VTRGGDYVFDVAPERLTAFFRSGFSRAPEWPPPCRLPLRTLAARRLIAIRRGSVQAARQRLPHSHSMVPGGLEVTS
jgi:hypothetical protein